MRKIIVGMAAAVAMIFISMGGVSAAPLGGGQTLAPGGSDNMIVRVDYSCRHLRHECHEERERGYEGRACHRYQEYCGYQGCRHLRHECHEEREGNGHYGACQRYEDQCR